ncbi:retrovirus-related pol polyprotein from transposon TNT 1-94 [Tanacetum coccineum]
MESSTSSQPYQQCSPINLTNLDMNFEDLMFSQEYNYNQDYSMGHGLGHSLAHDSVSIHDEEHDSPVEETSPVKPKKPLRRVTKDKKDEPKDAPKEWTVKEEIALCQGWCDVSENNILGNSVKAKGFWGAVIRVVEMKNQTLQEMSHTMLNEQFIPQRFWCHAIETASYILNRVLIRKTINKTPYETLRGKKPSLKYFRVIGCKCIISKSLENLTSIDSIPYNDIFLGYSQTSNAYIVLNKETLKIEESLNVTFDESLPKSRTSPLVDDELIEEQAIYVTPRYW